MIKLVLKLAVAALIANAVIRVGAAYLVHVQFRDTVRQEAARAQSAADLQQRVLDVADAYEVPLEGEAFEVEWAQRQRLVRGEYVKELMVVPGMAYPWPFSWEIDVYVPPSADQAEPEPR
jgi:hypothetical protein